MCLRYIHRAKVRAMKLITTLFRPVKLCKIFKLQNRSQIHPSIVSAAMLKSSRSLCASIQNSNSSPTHKSSSSSPTPHKAIFNHRSHHYPIDHPSLTPSRRSHRVWGIMHRGAAVTRGLLC